jgi:polyisoprenoid-binding protein YceI
MKMWKLFTGVMVTFTSISENVSAKEFDFKPLASLCRVEVKLSTSFGSGSVRGTFGKIAGKIAFTPEYPQDTNGRISLSSRSLRFNNAKIAYDSHSPKWLNSSKYPEISFQMNSLRAFSWHGRELRADAEGTLTIKGNEKAVTIPMSIHYFRGQRRQYEGKAGDLLKIEGLLAIPISEFGLSAGAGIDAIGKEVEVMVSVTGASNHVRPLLPSPLFR